MSLSSKKLHILHAEDNKEVFESCKESILSAFDKKALPEPVIENIEHGNGIFRKIMELKEEKEVYDILLLDLELLDKSEYNGINAIIDVNKFSPHTKIFVLSGKIYDPAYLEELQKYKNAGMIVGYFETSSHYQWCTKLIEVVMAKDIGILHFSDMHISAGGNSEQIISGFIEQFKEKTDLLIFSGDISNRGKMEEFEIAKRQLSGMCDALGIQKNIYVPGNHDIQRNSPPRTAFKNYITFKRTMEKYIAENELDEILKYPDADNYADYLNIVTVFPELRTIVCGLNSATCIPDEKFGYDYGEVTAKQLGMSDKKLQKIKEKYPNYLLICTFHHNIFEPPYYFDYHETGSMRWIPPVKKQGLILKKCMENGTHLLLTGHSHVSSSFSLKSDHYGDAHPLHILSAGLLSEKGVTPLEPQLTVNYITYQIDLSGNIMDMKCHPYQLDLTGGNWEEKKSYRLDV